MSTNFMPKNYFEGRDSNGTSFSFKQWDYTTIANLEFASFMMTLLVSLALSAIVAPIITLITINYFNGRNKFMYLIAAIISAYFLYDCAHGWLGVKVWGFLLSEKNINILVYINLATLVINIIFLLVGNFINNLIMTPYKVFAEEEDYELQTQEVKDRLSIRLGVNYMIFLTFLILMSFFGLIFSGYVIKDKGWVEKNIGYAPRASNE